MTSRLKVIYVVGAARSGSTVLDTVLGSHKDVESIGELTYAARALTSNSEFCACGELAAECAFWSDIQETWTNLWPERPSLEKWSALQARYEQPFALPKLLWGMKTRMPATFSDYLKGIETLYQAIRQVSGKSVIVDSSKNPIRAIAICQSPAIDLRLIHLVRDCRGVIWSQCKNVEADPRGGVEQHLNPRSAWRTALLWYATNRVAEYSTELNCKENSLLVRYEDFAANPEKELLRISKLTKIDFSAVADALRQKGDLKAGHIIAGNRLRMNRSIKLQPDLSWHGRLSRTQKLAFCLIARSTARRYYFPESEPQ